jgi:HD superfamily phosphohydrolase
LKLEIRDPIHGLIEYNEQEEKILNTKVMQRLRGIKQLALANLVYPGANHTRFEHSIGVMSVADRMAKQLKLPEEDIKVIRIAGSLHDIGHGPFSHVSEQILGKYVDEEMKKRYDIEEVHEAITIDIINHDEELKEIIAKEKEEVISIIKKGNLRSTTKDIISGPMDADKLDYSLRDSYYTGAKYGVFDLDKVINSLTHIEMGGDEVQVGINEEGKYAVEQLLLAIYHMNVQVYRHRGRRITDAMTTRGIHLALKENVEEIQRLYRYNSSKEYVSHYLQFDDSTLIKTIMKEGKADSKFYFARLINRKLLKEIFRMKIDPENIEDSVHLGKIQNLNEHQGLAIEKEIAKMMSSDLKSSVSPNFVIIDKQSTSNPTFKFPEVQIRADTIMVRTDEGPRKTFQEVSKVFANSTVSPTEEYISVYGPLDDLTREERDKKKEKYKKEIKSTIVNNL